MSLPLAEELLENQINGIQKYLLKKNQKEWDFDKNTLEGSRNTQTVLICLLSNLLTTTKIYCPEDFENIIKRVKD